MRLNSNQLTCYIVGTEFGMKVVGGRMCTGGFNGVYVAKVTRGSFAEQYIKEGLESNGKVISYLKIVLAQRLNWPEVDNTIFRKKL